VLALIAGCGGTSVVTASYDASDNQMVYEMDRVTVARGASESAGYASQSNVAIVIKGAAQCRGRDCTPGEVRLSFLVDGKTRDFSISDRRVSITADGEKFEWGQEEEWNRVEDVRDVGSSGHLMTVPIPYSDVKQIATASSVSGLLGSRSLDMNSVQSRLQDFLREVEGPDAESETS